MTLHRLITLVAFLLTTIYDANAQPVTLSSPDGRLAFRLLVNQGKPAFELSFDGHRLLKPSPLGLRFADGLDFGNGVRAGTVSRREGLESYILVVGKNKVVSDPYREMVLPLQKTDAGRQILLRVRAFKDGVAFRYEIPAQEGWSSYTLTREYTGFRPEGDPTMLAMYLPGYTTSHEGRYSRQPFSQIRPDTLMDMPALLTFSGPVYMAITEAALVDYAGMYLMREHDQLSCRLSPLPGQDTLKVKAVLPHHTPWRVMMISHRAGDLLESNLLTDLNEPCQLKDVSWIKPGKTDFHWWNGDIVPDTTFAPGINFMTNKYYIDFCAENHIDYHSVIGYGGTAWYVNDGVSYQPGPHSNPSIPVPGLDMARICDYARQKGVGIRVWVHWAALYPHLEETFSRFEEWGVKGMMVDFMDRDDQEMVNIQHRILASAARHHLHIQFHGAYKPTGMSRTYPNEFTREGTLNYENDKWGNLITPDDDIHVVFTRLLAGPTDYHLGGFRAVPPEQYRAQYTRPLVVGTRCHMMAMYVVLESYLQMVCDYPDAYRGQPGFAFLQEVPTVWDETRVVGAEPGQWVSIARRKGDTWYVGTITNHEGRSLVLPLQFLGEGHYRAEIYADAEDCGPHPNHLTQTQQLVNRAGSIAAHLAAGGGQVIVLRKE